VIKTITNEFIIVTTWPKINLSCPNVSIGHPVSLQYWLKHNKDAGFPLKDCGNDTVWDFGSIESI